MQGKVLQYDTKTLSGFILDDDKNRYGFDQVDWKELKRKPKEGLVISFDVDPEDEKKAVEIIPIPLRGGASLPMGTFILGLIAMFALLIISDEPSNGAIIKLFSFSLIPLGMGGYGLWKKQENKKGWMVAGMFMGFLGALMIFDLL